MFGRHAARRGVKGRRVAAVVLGFSVALPGLVWMPPASGVAAPIYLYNCGSLSKGSTGGCVVELQNLLLQQGYSPGTVDGIFGDNTKTAVRNFQNATSLTVDVIVGPNTKAKLYTRQVTVTNSTCPANLSQAANSRGGCVAYIQARLNSVNTAGLAVDGVFGPATNTAVRNYQSSRCLAVDGIVGTNTKSALTTNKAKCTSTPTAPTTSPTTSVTTKTKKIARIREYDQPDASMWCWAASIQMASHSVKNENREICTIVTAVKSINAYSCPTFKFTPANLKEVSYGLRYVGLDGVLTADINSNRGSGDPIPKPEKLVESIDAGRPIIMLLEIIISPPSSLSITYAGHFIYIYGYKVTGTQYTFYYFDPDPKTQGEQSVTYTALFQKANRDTWTVAGTIYNIQAQ